MSPTNMGTDFAPSRCTFSALSPTGESAHVHHDDTVRGDAERPPEPKRSSGEVSCLNVARVLDRPSQEIANTNDVAVLN